jgi:DNA-binding transcriptional ArsR family regulator
MATPEHDPIPDVFTIDRPEQLKALGHPLRLRVLETLGETDTALTNRELAQRLAVDPGHLHFHVRMLLRAGLIQHAETPGGREKPYRAVAKTLKVAPELVSAGASTLHVAVMDEIQRAQQEHGSEGRFRFVRVTVRMSPEKAMEVLTDLVPKLQEMEDESGEPLVITAIMHPPPSTS